MLEKDIEGDAGNDTNEDRGGGIINDPFDPLDSQRGRSTTVRGANQEHHSTTDCGGLVVEDDESDERTCRNDSRSKSRSRPRKSFRDEMKRITLHFTPSWFSVNMGTGITSILLHELPYQFKGLRIIADIIFGLNVVLFLLFLGISIARYTIWPQMGPLMLFHPSQSLFLGTFAMGMTTIVSMSAIAAAPAWGNGFVIFTWILWWITVILAIVICTGLPFIQFTRHVQSLEQMSAIWLLPLVTPVVTASSGGIVADILPPSHARLTLIVSYIIWGMGFGTAYLVMSIYDARQAIHKIPPAAIIVSVFLPLGPCGQGAFGLLKMSSVLYKLARQDGQVMGSINAISPSDIFSTKAEAQIMASAIYAVSIPIALVLWGLGLFWLILAVSTLIDLAKVSKLQFNLGWWGFTFPIGVFSSAAVQFGKELDSGFFRIFGTVLSLIEVALWLTVSSFTVLRVIEGHIPFSPCLAEQGGEPPRTLAPSRKYTYQPRETTVPNST